MSSRGKGTLRRQVGLKEFSDELAKFLQPRLKEPIEFGARGRSFTIGSAGKEFSLSAEAPLGYFVEELVDVPALNYTKGRSNGRKAQAKSKTKRGKK